jgi:LacI family transcriptional regulator
VSEQRKSKVITLDDLARHAGVSRSTVSLVLRESLLPAAATRKRVQEAVKELGYVYNRGAASLRSRQTMVVGMVVGDITNPFFADMVAGAQSTLDEADRVLLLVNTSESPDVQERYITRLREHGVDGLIVSAAPGTGADYLDEIRHSGTPIVEALRRVEGSHGDFVGIDFEAATIEATEHLIERGHRRIAFIGGNLEHSATRERHAGFASTLARHGLEAGPIIPCPVTRQAGYQAAATLLQEPEAPTAAITYSDRTAFGVMAAALDRGLKVGSGFALVGFDDLEQAELSRPTLTTVATQPQVVGREAGRVLVARMHEPEAPRVEQLVPTLLIVRDSSGPAPVDKER